MDFPAWRREKKGDHSLWEKEKHLLKTAVGVRLKVTLKNGGRPTGGRGENQRRSVPTSLFGREGKKKRH